VKRFLKPLLIPVFICIFFMVPGNAGAGVNCWNSYSHTETDQPLDVPCYIGDGQWLKCRYQCDVQFFDIECEWVFDAEDDCPKEYMVKNYYDCELQTFACYGVICMNYQQPYFQPTEPCEQHCIWCP
jgi:hypothetical protein